MERPITFSAKCSEYLGIVGRWFDQRRSLQEDRKEVDHLVGTLFVNDLVKEITLGRIPFDDWAPHIPSMVNLHPELTGSNLSLVRVKLDRPSSHYLPKLEIEMLFYVRPFRHDSVFFRLYNNHSEIRWNLTQQSGSSMVLKDNQGGYTGERIRLNLMKEALSFVNSHGSRNC